MKSYLFFLCLFAINPSIAIGKRFNISTPKYEIKNNRVIAEGFGSTLEAGNSWLPSRVVWIIIPPYSEITRCNVRGMPQLIPQKIETPISIPILLREGDSPLTTENNKLKVENKISCQDSIGKYLGTFEFRGYKFAKVMISPFTYNQETQKLWWTPDITIDIDYTYPKKIVQVDTTLDDFIFPLNTIPTHKVLNLDAAKEWYRRTSIGSHNYVIIVPEELRTVVQDFAEWKETIGHKVKIISSESQEFIGNPKYILVIGDSVELQSSTGCIIGRIPYTDVDILSSILENTIEFEINGVDKKILFVKGISNYENEDFSGIPQENKNIFLKELESVIPTKWNYRESNSEIISGNYPIINFLTHSKIWLWDDGDEVPEAHEIKLSKYFLYGEIPSFVFAPFDAKKFLKQGAACVVAPDSKASYMPNWNNISDGGSQSFNYIFLKYLMENEIVGDAFLQAKFWYETNFPKNTQKFEIWGDPSLNLHGIPKVDIEITEAPVSWLFPDSVFSPVCIVHNLGRIPETNCKVFCEIDSNEVPIYMEHIVIDTLKARGESIVEFPEWSKYCIGADYKINFKVFSYRDENPNNDTLAVSTRVAGGDFLVSDTLLNNVLCELGYKGMWIDESENLKIKNEWLENFKVLFISDEMNFVIDSLPKNLYIEKSNLWLNELLSGKNTSEVPMSLISGMGFSFNYSDKSFEWFLPNNYDTIFSDKEGKVCGFSYENEHKIWCTRFRFSEIPDSMRVQYIEKVMHFFEIEVPDSVTSMKEDVADSNIILFSCLPNPFCQKTRIKFNIKKYPTKANLSIYSLAGTLVKKLFDGFLECGVYEFAWNGCNDEEKSVVNGIYFLRLQADEETKLLKLIVFK